MEVGAVVVVAERTAEANAELELLYERQFPDLVRLASLLLDDRSAAEEVVQDAFVRALISWRTIRDPERAPAFLRSAVLNGARSRLRRWAVARRHPQGVHDRVESDESRSVAHQAMVAALRGLPTRQRESVVLRYYLDLPEREIAQVMGVSAGSVKTHLHRGLQALARGMEVAS